MRSSYLLLSVFNKCGAIHLATIIRGRLVSWTYHEGTMGSCVFTQNRSIKKCSLASRDSLSLQTENLKLTPHPSSPSGDF